MIDVVGVNVARYVSSVLRGASKIYNIYFRYIEYVYQLPSYYYCVKFQFRLHLIKVILNENLLIHHVSRNFS